MDGVSLIVLMIAIVVAFLLIGFKKTVKIFISPDEGESLGGKAVKTGVAAIIYFFYHYAIAMVIAAKVVLILHSWGFSLFAIFIIMWALNALNGFVVLIINDRTKKDLTLSGGLRRLVDETIALSEIPFIVKTVLWDGPAEATIFLRPRMKSKKEELFLFSFAAGLQMILWVPIYLYGLPACYSFLK